MAPSPVELTCQDSLPSDYDSIEYRVGGVRRKPHGIFVAE